MLHVNDKALSKYGLVVCVCIYTIFCLLVFRFTIDDAYIAYLFAKNLVEHGQLVPSEDTYVQGFVNFLYIIVCSVGYFFSGKMNIESVMKFFLIVCGGINIILVNKILIGENIKKAGLPFLLFLATSTPFIVWTVGGLETIFLSMQLTAFAMLFQKSYYHKEASPLFFIVATTTCMSRLDMCLVIAPLAIALFFQADKKKRFIIQGAFLFVLPVAIYLLWTYKYYGTLLPTPSTKATVSIEADRFRLGYEYFIAFLSINNHWALLALSLFGGFIALRKSNLNSPLFYILISTFPYIIYIISQGVVHMMFTFRFYTPLIPLFTLTAAKGFDCLLSKIHHSKIRQSVVACSCFLVLIVNLANFHYAYFNNMLFIDKPGHDFVDKVKFNNMNIRGLIITHEIWKNAAIYFNQLIPSDTSGFCWSAGIFPFFIDAKIYDNRLIGSIDGHPCNFIIWFDGNLPSDKIIAKYPFKEPSKLAAMYPWHTTFYLLQ